MRGPLHGAVATGAFLLTIPGIMAPLHVRTLTKKRHRLLVAFVTRTCSAKALRGTVDVAALVPDATALLAAEDIRLEPFQVDRALRKAIRKVRKAKTGLDTDFERRALIKAAHERSLTIAFDPDELQFIHNHRERSGSAAQVVKASVRAMMRAEQEGRLDLALLQKPKRATRRTPA